MYSVHNTLNISLEKICIVKMQLYVFHYICFFSSRAIENEVEDKDDRYLPRPIFGHEQLHSISFIKIK